MKDHSDFHPQVDEKDEKPEEGKKTMIEIKRQETEFTEPEEKNEGMEATNMVWITNENFNS